MKCPECDDELPNDVWATTVHMYLAHRSLFAEHVQAMRPPRNIRGDIEAAAYEDPREWVQTAIMMVRDGFSLSQTSRLLGKPRTTLHYALFPSKRALRLNRHPACSRCGNPMSYPSEEPEPLCRSCRTEVAEHAA